MDHKKVFDSIDEHFLDNKPLENEILDHISSCKKCNSYFKKSRKFYEGISKIREYSNSLSEFIKIDHSRDVNLPLSLFFTKFKRTIILGIAVLVVLLGLFGYFFMLQYNDSIYILENELNEEFLYTVTYNYPSYEFDQFGLEDE